MKYVCTVCGWSTESDKAPEKCPLCGATTFKAIGDGEKVYATEHKVGDGKVEDKEVMDGLRAHFTGECTEVGMYLAMARVAEREGYPEVSEAFKRYAYEEAEHGATAGKFDLAKRAKAANLDAIHDTVHEMAKDEARHGKGFDGLLKRYFN